MLPAGEGLPIDSPTRRIFRILDQPRICLRSQQGEKLVSRQEVGGGLGATDRRPPYRDAPGPQGRSGRGPRPMLRPSEACRSQDSTLKETRPPYSFPPFKTLGPVSAVQEEQAALTGKPSLGSYRGGLVDRFRMGRSLQRPFNRLSVRIVDKLAVVIQRFSGRPEIQMLSTREDPSMMSL